MNLEIIRRIWGYGTGEFVFTPVHDRTRPDGPWHRGSPHMRREDLSQTDLAQRWGFDIYFTPMTFQTPELNNHPAPGMVLYADLDASHPESLEIMPNVAWETSPGSYQAVWFTGEIMPPDQHQDLNQRMTYFCRADKGGWSGAKVLRIPGSLNFKRARMEAEGLVVPVGKLLWYRDAFLQSPEWLENNLPYAQKRGPAAVGYPAVRKAVARDDVPLLVWALHMKPNVDDRSIHIWKVAKACVRQGVPIDTAWDLISTAPYNKYADRPNTLWNTLTQAYAEED